MSLTTEFFNFGRKKSENLSFKNGHFSTNSCHFFCQLHNNLSQDLSADSHVEVQNMSKFDWIKSYTIKQKLFCFHLFQFWQKKV